MANRSNDQHAAGDQTSSSNGNSSSGNAGNTGGSPGQGRAEQTQQIRPYDWVPTPFNLARRFTEDLGRLFLALNQAEPGTPFENAQRPIARGASWTPTVEVTSRGDDLVIQADLPGVKPEDVQVEIEGNNIIIRGESRYERENKQGDYFYSERSYGSFYRSIPLPTGVNTDNARAELKGAALEVVLPGGAKVLVPKRRPLKIEMPKQSTQQAQQTQTETASGTTSDQQATSPA
jgi:HSP20 family protein